MSFLQGQTSFHWNGNLFPGFSTKRLCYRNGFLNWKCCSSSRKENEQNCPWHVPSVITTILSLYLVSFLRILLTGDHSEKGSWMRIYSKWKHVSCMLSSGSVRLSQITFSAVSAPLLAQTQKTRGNVQRSMRRHCMLMGLQENPGVWMGEKSDSFKLPILYSIRLPPFACVMG